MSRKDYLQNGRCETVAGTLALAIQVAPEDATLLNKTSNTLIIFGALVAFAGLCFLPAAMVEKHDASLLAAGASLFSLGTLFTSGGLYIKAKGQKSGAPASPEPAKRAHGGCETCREGNPVIHCKVHNTHLCEDCQAKHYDFRSCVYAPSTRRMTAKGGRHGLAKAHRA